MIKYLLFLLAYKVQISPAFYYQLQKHPKVAKEPWNWFKTDYDLEKERSVMLRFVC